MKRYQAVAFLLSTAMTVSSVAPVFGASNDIFGHWAEFTITKWQNEGRIGGYEDGTFKPDRAITRAEFVRLLNSAAPTAFTSSASINFSDVSESDWFYADVAKAVGGRVASGFEDGTFRPGETVTRMQAAVFICNAKGLTPNEAAANNFTDAASIPSWAKGAVGAAVAAGYLSGYPDGSFGGSKGMTRAEAVSTLDRVLGGGSTTTTPSGEIDTTNRDNNNSTEDNRTAEAGNMVWTSGGSGGGSKKSSSSSSSSSSDKKTNNVTIRSQKEANEYEGKTLTGTTSIYVDGSGIDLKDIRFKGDVDIYADDTATAAAYIGEDTAVAAANSTVDIYFEGKTNVSGQITVIRNTVAGADKVVIKTRTPRALSASVLAKVATKIVGFELNKVEAQAPVEIAEGAKVNTVEAGDNAVVEVAADASVDKVDVTGDAKDVVLNGEGSTDVTVKNGASADNVVVDGTKATVELEGSAKVDSVAVVGNGEAAVKVNDNAKVENVQVSDSASADIAVADKATVNKVELSDTATAKVDVAPEAKVDTISSTSTGKTEVSGEGTVDKIEATNPSTIDTSNAGENIPDVEQKEEEKPSTPATVTITAADLGKIKLVIPTDATKAAEFTGVPTGVKVAAEKWSVVSTSATADETTTKQYEAAITLTPETGYIFDAEVKVEDLTGLKDVIVADTATASATEIKFIVKADIEDSGSVIPPEDKTPASIIFSSSAVDPTKPLNQGSARRIVADVKNKDGYQLSWNDIEGFDWIITDSEGKEVDTTKVEIKKELLDSGQSVTIKNVAAEEGYIVNVSAEIEGVTLKEVSTMEITMTTTPAELYAIRVEPETSNNKTKNFRPNDTVTFTLEGRTLDNEIMDIPDGGTYKWSTTDTNYSTEFNKITDATATLTISADDAGLTAGTTTTKDITVTAEWTPKDGTESDKKTGDATIKAEPAAVEKSITLNPNEVEVEKGKIQAFTSTVKNQYNEDMANVDGIEWSVEGNNDKTGTKVENGTLTVSDAETADTLTVKATKGDITGSATVNVKEATATPIEKEIAITLSQDSGFTLNTAKDGITVEATTPAKTVADLLAAVSVTVDGEADASATKKVFNNDQEKTTGDLVTGDILRVISSADPEVTKDFIITVGDGNNEDDKKEDVTATIDEKKKNITLTADDITSKTQKEVIVTLNEATIVTNYDSLDAAKKISVSPETGENTKVTAEIEATAEQRTFKVKITPTENTAAGAAALTDNFTITIPADALELVENDTIHKIPTDGITLTNAITVTVPAKTKEPISSITLENLVKPADESTLTTGTNVAVPGDAKYEVQGEIPSVWTVDDANTPTKYTITVTFVIATDNADTHEFANNVTFNVTDLTDITVGNVTVDKSGVATVTLEVAADKVTA